MLMHGRYLTPTCKVFALGSNKLGVAVLCAGELLCFFGGKYFVLGSER